MRKIKIFINSDGSHLECEINEFLSENPRIQILNIFATEIVINPASNYDNQSYMTVYILYSEG